MKRPDVRSISLRQIAHRVLWDECRKSGLDMSEFVANCLEAFSAKNVTKEQRIAFLHAYKKGIAAAYQREIEGIQYQLKSRLEAIDKLIKEIDGGKKL